MTQCCFCMKWYHTECCDFRDTSPAIWLCSTCRKMPKVISKLVNQIVEIKEELARMCTLSSDLLTLYRTRTCEYNQIQNENIALKEQLTGTITRLSKPSEKSFRYSKNGKHKQEFNQYKCQQ